MLSWMVLIKKLHDHFILLKLRYHAGRKGIETGNRRAFSCIVKIQSNTVTWNKTILNLSSLKSSKDVNVFTGLQYVDDFFGKDK